MATKRAAASPEAATPAEPSQKTDFTNLRNSQRYSFRGRASAVFLPQTPDGSAEEWEVVTTDLSRSGVSIMHRKKLAQGQQIMLILNEAKQFVEVCWCCQVWPNLYAAGCRFIDEPAGAAEHTMAADEQSGDGDS